MDTNYLEQIKNAQEMESSLIARLQDMERRGIVKHVIQDEWEVLDQKRYDEEMGSGDSRSG